MTRAIYGYLRTNFDDYTLYKLKLAEFINIGKSLGYEKAEVIIQNNKKPDPSFLFGKGKVEEIKQIIEELNIEAFIIYNLLTSSQRINLEDYLNVKILDRYDLILEVFEKNSGDRLSKLQIEYARIQRYIPYVKKRIAWEVYRDRPGPKSLGEYAYHKIIAQMLARRKKIKKEIEYYKEIKEKQIEERKEKKLPIVTLCGFYNAGKTSLFNALTKLSKPVSEIPFTTLSSKYYKIKHNMNSFLLVDTIGFAFDIDPLIIESFELTLKDIINADLILLIIDAKDEEILFKEKIKTNLEIFNKLKIKEEKIIPVLNKVDLIDKNEINYKIEILEEFFENEPIYVSATEKYNLDLLLDRISQSLKF